MDTKRKKRPRSILISYLIPMIAVLLFQTVFFIAAVFLSGTFDEVKYISSSLLNEAASNRSQQFEKTYNDNWTNLSSASSEIVSILDGVLADNDKTYSDLMNPANEDLATDAINNVANELFLILRQNSVSGSFIIFGNESDGAKLGLYYRDKSPNETIPDNKDIYYEVAPYGFSNPLGLQNANNVERSFFRNSNTDYQKDFFINPITNNSGWLSSVFTFRTENIMTYSIPLVNSNKQIFGVLGVELSVKMLLNFLQYSELYMADDGSYIGTYFLGSFDDINHIDFKSMILSSFNSNVLDDIDSYSIKPTNIDSVYELSYGDKTLIVSVQVLDLYQRNSPFENQKWYIIGGVPMSNLYAKSNNLLTIIIIVISSSFILGMAIIGTASYLFSRPIMDLTSQVRKSKSIRNFHFKNTNISEIDDLTSSIERLNNEVVESESKLANILGLVDMPIVAFEFDLSTNYLYLSSDLKKVIHLDDLNITTGSDLSKLYNKLQEHLVESKDNAVTIKYIDSDKKTCWLDIRLILNTNIRKSGIFVNVTKEYTEKELLLKERNLDSLTGIFNRRGFTDSIHKIFKDRSVLKQGAFLMMDLDNLKFINDTYGHDYGDELLKLTASIIRESAKNLDTCIYGRRSGDEFYVFMYGFDEFYKLSSFVNGILKRFNTTSLSVTNGNTHKIRISSGISLYPQDGIEPEELMHLADYAMYEAKTSAKGSIKYFDRESYDKNAYIIQNKEALNTLIEKELVDFYFQPIVDLRDGHIIGYESLMRSKIDAFKSPSEIISVGQSQYKLNQIEKLTFFKTMEKYRANIDMFNNSKIFINSFANQIMSSVDIDQFVKENKDYIKNIVLEVTEYEKSVPAFLNAKRDVIVRFGGQIALDDYGTAYSSETALLEASPNYVKIDMSLIRNIQNDPDRSSIVLNIILYAQNKGIKTLAEGVETVEELDAVIKLGCNYGQGYLFGKPAPLPEQIPEDVVKKIKDLNTKHYR